MLLHVLPSLCKSSPFLVETDVRNGLTFAKKKKKNADEELDVIEMSVYGNIKKSDFRCRCKSFYEMDEAWRALAKKSRRHRKVLAIGFISFFFFPYLPLQLPF